MWLLHFRQTVIFFCVSRLLAHVLEHFGFINNVPDGVNHMTLIEGVGKVLVEHFHIIDNRPWLRVST